MATLTVDLSSYDYANSTAVENASYPFSNAFAGSASTGDYARITVPTGANAEVTSYYRFDLSALPAGATINSIVVKYKAKSSNTSGMSARTISVVSGTTVKGTAQTLGTTVTDDKTFGQIMGLSEAEVRALGIKLYAKRGTSGTSNIRYIAMYGATLTVDYTPSADRHYIRESGAWRQLSNPAFYKKVNGVWVLQSASPFTTTGKYKRKSLLPDAYQQVDCLQSDGVAFIRTAFTSRPGYTVTMLAQCISTDGALVGDYSGAGGWAGAVSNKYALSDSDMSTINASTKQKLIITFDSSETSMTFEDSTSISVSWSHTISTGRRYCLFASNNGNKVMAARMWYAIFEYGGEIVAYFIPCYRVADNTYGFYDIIGDAFYDNAADSGSFTTTTR